MAKQPIDITGRPSMISTRCGGDNCDEWIVVDRAYTGTGHCSSCLNRIVERGDEAVTADPPPQWFSKHNPPPPDPQYPPGQPIVGLRTADPNVSGYCLSCPIGSSRAVLQLMSLSPDDIHIAVETHRRLWHTRDGWLIGGPGGADGDVCNPCGGAYWDKEQGKVLPLQQPRHDHCLRGRTRGRGRDCPCNHDRPYMRGVKPGAAEKGQQVQQVQQILAAHRPQPVQTAITDYLTDPEEDPNA